MNEIVQEVRPKRKLVLRKDQEFTAPLKTETHKQLEFDLGAEAVNPLLAQEKPQANIEPTKEQPVEPIKEQPADPAKKISLKDRFAKKKSEAFKPEENPKKEAENNNIPKSTISDQAPINTPHVPHPGANRHQANQQSQFVQMNPHMMYQMNQQVPQAYGIHQGYTPEQAYYGYGYAQAYYAQQNFMKHPSNYAHTNQGEGSYNLKASLNPKVPYQPKPYASGASKYSQSDRSAKTEEYTIKPDASDKEVVATQDISIAEPVEEEKKPEPKQVAVAVKDKIAKEKTEQDKKPQVANGVESKEPIAPATSTIEQKIAKVETPAPTPVKTVAVDKPPADVVAAVPETPSKAGVFSAEFLEKYISEYSGGLPEEFKHLDRKIKEVEAPQKKKNEYPRGKGRKHERADISKPGQKYYGDFKKENKPVEAPKTEVLQRQHVSEETLIQIKKIKQNADHWLATKKDDDITIVNFKTIKSLLNKLTGDNFEKISKEIFALAQNKEIIKKLVDFVVVKAWNEPRYTKIYAELVFFLAEQKFEWDKTGKTIRTDVLSKVEAAYTQGFKNYYDLTREIHDNTTMSEIEKNEHLYKQKVMLLGNINFICELFFFKILNFKVFKVIILYGIASFVKEYIRAEESKDKFTIKEDYLEALLKLFENSGKMIDKKERTDDKKTQNGKNDFSTEEHIIDEFFNMIDEREDRADMFMEKDKLDKYVKTLNNISYIFFEVAKKIKTENVSVRLHSLITNLEEYRDSNWTVEVHKIGAAKSKRDVQKEIEREKEKTYEKERYDYEDDFNPRKGNRDNYASNKNFSRKSTKKQNDSYPERRSNNSLNVPETAREIATYLKENKGFLTEAKFIDFTDQLFNENYKDGLTAYLLTFAKTNQETINAIIHYPYLLLRDSYITSWEFNEATEAASLILYLEFSDAPFLVPSLASILFEGIDNNLLSLNDFAWKCPPGLQGEDFDPDEYEYFSKEMLKAVEKKFKSEDKLDLISADIDKIKDKISS